MKILITGSHGYIGPLLLEKLKSYFPDSLVHCIDTNFFDGCDTDPDFVISNYFDKFIRLDIRSTDVGSLYLGDYDVIILLAALSNDPIGSSFAELTNQINYAANVNLLKSIPPTSQPKIIFASSCSTYGSMGDSNKTEDSPLNPLSAYAKSKVDFEFYLTNNHLDFQKVSLRFATACGWSPRLRLDLVLNDFVASAITSNEINVLSDGTPLRPLIDVQDMINSICWACASDFKVGHTIYNVGCNEWNFSVKEIADEVASCTGANVTINPSALSDPRSYRVCFDKFKQDSWAYPTRKLSDTIMSLINGIRRMNIDPGFRDSKYIRLQHLKNLIELGSLNSTLERS